MAKKLSVKKAVEETRDSGAQELDLQDRSIASLSDVPFLSEYQAKSSAPASQNLDRLTKTVRANEA